MCLTEQGLFAKEPRQLKRAFFSAKIGKDTVTFVGDLMTDNDYEVWYRAKLEAVIKLMKGE